MILINLLCNTQLAISQDVPIFIRYVKKDRNVFKNKFRTNQTSLAARLGQSGHFARVNLSHVLLTTQINKSMQVVVPAAIAQVNTTHERHRLIDHYALFMMRPEEHAGNGVLRVPEHFYIRILSILCENVFRTWIVQIEHERELLVEQNIDFDAFFGFLKQNFIQSKLKIVGGPTQEQLRAQPPGSYENLLLGVIQRVHHVLQVHVGVDEPAALLLLSSRRERIIG